MILNSLGLLSVSLILALIITVIFNTYFDTPTEALLKKENKTLSFHLASLAETYDDAATMMKVLKQRDTQLYTEIYDVEPNANSLVPESPLAYLKEDILQPHAYKKEVIGNFGHEVENILLQTEKSNSKLKEIFDIANKKIGDLEFIPTIQPVSNPDQSALVSGFGMRINPFHHGNIMHEGIDFSAPRGTPVYATATGTVNFIKKSEANTGFGNQVKIEHGNGFETKYTHLQEIIIKEGQEVKKGEIIGHVGSTGGIIAPAVHYELIQNGKKIDPVNYMIEGLVEAEYVKLLELALQKNQSLD
ncbi:MAG: M23 family metallopeptidase [Cyclobacteriaceae bacterium]|nr:M23 family metallopeptidase [Cyclobacteriaceae bacterium]